MKSHLSPLFISYRSSGEKLIKYQANSSCVIMFVIFTSALFWSIDHTRRNSRLISPSDWRSDLQPLPCGLSSRSSLWCLSSNYKVNTVICFDIYVAPPRGGRGGGGGGGGGTQQRFIRGGSSPRSKPLPVPFFTKRYPFPSYAFFWQMVPLSHTLFRTLHLFKLL